MFASPRSELLALLATIKAEPEEDTPKLALADRLQEQPGGAGRGRGEFLKLFVGSVPALEEKGSDSRGAPSIGSGPVIGITPSPTSRRRTRSGPMRERLEMQARTAPERS